MLHINLFLAYILRSATSILKDYFLKDGFALSKDIRQTGELLGIMDNSLVSVCMDAMLFVDALSVCDTLGGKALSDC